MVFNRINWMFIYGTGAASMDYGLAKFGVIFKDKTPGSELLFCLNILLLQYLHIKNTVVCPKGTL